jgi:hypothetical protein
MSNLNLTRAHISGRQTPGLPGVHPPPLLYNKCGGLNPGFGVLRRVPRLTRRNANHQRNMFAQFRYLNQCSVQSISIQSISLIAMAMYNQRSFASTI